MKRSAQSGGVTEISFSKRIKLFLPSKVKEDLFSEREMEREKMKEKKSVRL